MFGPPIDEAFINRTGRAARGEGQRGGLLLLAVLAGLGAFFWWAATFEIEETVRGPGRVVPSQQVQVVQSLEGGIVRDIMVEAGEIVEADTPLIRIDDTTAGARRGEMREQEAALLAELTRLETEAAGNTVLTFPETLIARVPKAVEAEQQVFGSRQRQFASELQVLEDQLDQRQTELVETRAMIAKLEGQVGPLSEEVALTRDYVETGAVTRIELLRLESQLAELEGELHVARAGLPRRSAAISEARSQIASARGAYVLNARERAAKVEAELAVLREGLRAAEDRVTRTVLRAPVRGVVNTLSISTLGAVVGPGESLVEIVPTDDHLLIEARIAPRDVAFIAIGKPASVKITAFDYITYGALSGEVTRIGADALATSDGEPYFQVMVRTGDTRLGEAELSPGMVAQIDIQTGRKTVLDYLLKPFTRAQTEALRER